KQLCLDSCWYRPSNNWVWSTDTGTIGEAFPPWTGPHCFFINDPDYVPPSNLVLSETELSFLGVQGEANPTYQSFDVNTDNNALSFTVDEGAGWLSVSPSVGTTPQTINVFVSTSSLSAGTYNETIMVESASAENSPQSIEVELTVIPPPPEIGINPEAFVFLGITDGDNPEPKTLNISNVGGSTLNWTVSNSESWLSLVPLSGSETGSVELTVDITGLGFGDHFDSVIVSDPAAVNDPVYVPVTLTLGSNLPMIEADSAFNYIIVPNGSQTVPNRDVLIYNGGIGELNFWTVENSGRILSVTPISGTAPQVLDVGFKIIGGAAGDDFYDTLWIHSDDAVNSPFPVVFQFHYVDDPAVLQVDKDTVRFSVYPCSQGYLQGLPSTLVRVMNTGGDDPVMVKFLYESDLFDVMPDSAVATGFFVVKAVSAPPDFPFGTYYDTVLISAQKATNSPQILIVETTVLEPVADPVIVVDSTDMVFDIKEGGPIPGPLSLGLTNLHGGCLDWEIEEAIPWLNFSVLSGSAPDPVSVNLELAGYTLGKYDDSFIVVAPEASNNPLKVRVHLQIWRQRGDVNANGIINISDVSYLVNYLFGVPVGPAPYPSLKVGDVNCNEIVNISDVAYLVAYLFGIPLGPDPCNDP
ncbi:MAG: hypothetical protein KAT79_06260, partial [candidate division Zixibacteria bacterium]|nr:hypothetical protein [candidate division Zixibacteria bacterium]